MLQVDINLSNDHASFMLSYEEHAPEVSPHPSILLHGIHITHNMCNVYVLRIYAITCVLQILVCLHS